MFALGIFFWPEQSPEVDKSVLAQVGSQQFVLVHPPEKAEHSIVLAPVFGTSEWAEQSVLVAAVLAHVASQQLLDRHTCPALPVQAI